MKIFAYGRASTDKQHLTEKGQRRQCAEYIERTWPESEFVWLYDNDISGGTELFERPMGRQLWYGTEPGDHVVFVRIDRLFRNGPDGAKSIDMLVTKRVKMHFASLPGLDPSNPLAIGFVYSQLGMAVSEKALISDRTSVAMRELQRNGKPVNRFAPIGWRKRGKDFVPDMTEREQVMQLESMREEGMSLRKIEVKLHKYRRPCGLRWSKDSIRRALKARELGFPKVPVPPS